MDLFLLLSSSLFCSALAFGPAAEPAVFPAQAPAPREVLETFENDPIGVQRLVLDNGLTVLLELGPRSAAASSDH